MVSPIPTEDEEDRDYPLNMSGGSERTESQRRVPSLLTVINHCLVFKSLLVTLKDFEFYELYFPCYVKIISFSELPFPTTTFVLNFCSRILESVLIEQRQPYMTSSSLSLYSSSYTVT